jgi:hypothetical protein
MDRIDELLAQSLSPSVSVPSSPARQFQDAAETTLFPTGRVASLSNKIQQAVLPNPPGVAYLWPSFGLLGTNDVLVPLIHEAISKEKTRLVRSIIHYEQQQAAASTLAKSFQQPILPPQLKPDAVVVADKIGSEMRMGEPYIDVTKLDGIEQAEAVAPRANRGGHLATFPEVSRWNRPLIL